jgi:hypothetical protein
MYTGLAGNNKSKFSALSVSEYSNRDSTTTFGLLWGFKSLDLRVVAQHCDDRVP